MNMLNEAILFDAGLFIGALLSGDPRHAEARPLVEAGRRGEISACTTIGILSEVYAALTWVGAQPPHSPAEAALAVRLLVDSPSKIKILSESLEVGLKMLELSEAHQLTARRIHDARHVATTLINGVKKVYTYDTGDWGVFTSDGIQIVGPDSVIHKKI